VDERHPDAVLIDSASDCGRDGIASVADALPPGVPVLEMAVPALQTLDADGCFDALISKPVSRDGLLSAMYRFSRGGSVLVVDDDRGFVQLVRRIVLSAGAPFEVRWAYDGQEALEKLKECHPDLILVDMVMEPMSGSVLAKMIRGDGEMARIPIIAVTGATATLASGRVKEFRLVKRSGLRDGEAIAVLQSVLGSVRADYVPSETIS